MELVQNYIAMEKPSKKGIKKIVIHTILPFNELVYFLDILFDNGFKNLQEITSDEYTTLYMSSPVEAYLVDKHSFDNFVKKFNKVKD